MSEMLINGIEMPKDGDVIVIKIDEFGNIKKQDDYLNCFYDTEATAQELPPHGRLGDLDALEEQAFDDGSYLLVHNAPTIIEASSSPAGFCNTEGCSNSKPDMSKAQNHICPYYKSVCSLDERIICYRQHLYEVCDKFVEASKEKSK